MSFRKLLVEEREAVTTLTLNRPEKGNAVDGEMMGELVKALGQIGSDGKAQILLLRGAGDHFCSGREPGTTSPKTAREWSEVLSQIVDVKQALASFPGISIALVQGKAFGFGFGLAVRSDITLATEEARLAFPEIKAGFPPTVVLSYLSRWTARKKAFELVITGEEISAREAESLGLVNHVVPGRDLTSEGERWTAKLLEQNGEALKACKAFFRDTAHLHPDDAARLGITLLANFMSSRRS